MRTRNRLSVKSLTTRTQFQRIVVIVTTRTPCLRSHGLRGLSFSVQSLSYADTMLAQSLTTWTQFQRIVVSYYTDTLLAQSWTTRTQFQRIFVKLRGHLACVVVINCMHTFNFRTLQSNIFTKMKKLSFVINGKSYCKSKIS